MNKPAEVYLWSRPEATAARWLGEHSSASDVVLASTEYANPLAGTIDGRVVHGHIVATLHSSAKEALVHRFFAADAAAADRGINIESGQVGVLRQSTADAERDADIIRIVLSRRRRVGGQESWG